VLKKIATYSFILLVVNVVLYFLPTPFLYINIPLILMSSLTIFYSYKKAYYSFNTDYLTVGSGQFIDTITDYLELHKIQTVQFKQTVFQKRRAIASLVIYSASKALKIKHINENDAKNILNYFLYKVESSPKNWM
jgi:putative membrane protein